jgi:hypothetical protein
VGFVEALDKRTCEVSAFRDGERKSFFQKFISFLGHALIITRNMLMYGGGPKVKARPPASRTMDTWTHAIRAIHRIERYNGYSQMLCAPKLGPKRPFYPAARRDLSHSARDQQRFVAAAAYNRALNGVSARGFAESTSLMRCD